MVKVRTFYSEPGEGQELGCWPAPSGGRVGTAAKAEAAAPAENSGGGTRLVAGVRSGRIMDTVAF